MLGDPGAGRAVLDRLRRRPGQQRGERFLIDLARGQRVIQRAVPAAKGRHQRQLDQRRHRVIGAQDRIGQLEQRIRAGGQAPVQPGTELPQRHVPGNSGGDLGRIRGGGITAGPGAISAQPGSASKPPDPGGSSPPAGWPRRPAG